LPIPEIQKSFLFDRIWIILIPEPFTWYSRKKKKCRDVDKDSDSSNRKKKRYEVVDPNTDEVIREYEDGTCLVKNKKKREAIKDIMARWGKKWSDHAWTMYRTLLAIQLALRKVDKGLMKREDITYEKVKDLLKYGEKEIFLFEQKDGKFCVKIPFVSEGGKVGVLEKCFTEEQIRSVGYSEYTKKGKVYGQISYKLNEYITIVIRANPASRFQPHFIRIMINAIKWTKEKLGIDIDMGSIFDYEHDNFIDFSLLSEEMKKKVIETNHGILFELKNEILDMINDLLETWFGPNYFSYKWIPKISQIEICYDSYESKERLIGYAHYVKSIKKTTSASLNWGKRTKYNENTYEETKLGLKLYLQIKGGRQNLQMKIYTKAFNKIKNMALNRLEYTASVHKNLRSLKLEDVLRKDLLEVHEVVMRVSKLDSNVIVDLLKDKIGAFLKECENYSFYDRCVNFWIDMIISNGEMKGISFYEDVAKLYKQKGYIHIIGRGRNSKYLIASRYRGIVEMLNNAIKEYLGIFTKNIAPSEQPPPQKQKQNRTE